MSESITELDDCCLASFPDMGAITGHDRRILIRRARYRILDEIARGERDVEKITATVIGHMQADPVVGSLLTIIALAVLTAFIQWLVKRLLDRWFREHDEG